MKINWYVLNWLFNDDYIAQLHKDMDEAETIIDDLDKEVEMYQLDLETAKNTITKLSEDNDRLKKLLKLEHSVVDIDDERISTGTKEVDKKSPHSSFSRTQIRKIIKNALAADKRLYAIELAGDTNSMEPDIDDHTVLIFEKYDTTAKTVPLSEQDIVQYKHPDYPGYFVHRIRSIENNKYHIKGDNNKYFDGWFTDEVIKGRYVGKLIGKEEDGETDD